MSLLELKASVALEANHLPIGKHTCQTFSRSSWVGYDFSNLPSVFWFPSMRLVMSVHVDDLTLAGEASKHEGFWKTFQLHVNLDPPTELVMFFDVIIGWSKKFPRCLDMCWIIPARCSMIRKLSLFSCPCVGSTPSTENC